MAKYLVQGTFPEMSPPAVGQRSVEIDGGGSAFEEPRGWALQWDGDVLHEMVRGQNGCARPSSWLAQVEG